MFSAASVSVDQTNTIIVFAVCVSVHITKCFDTYEDAGIKGEFNVLVIMA